MYWQWRMIEKLKRKWLVVLKLTWGTWRILTRALESLKNLRFHWLLVTKVYNVWAKTVQRSYLSWHCRVMQNVKKKLDLWFEKWHEKFGKFSLEHLKLSKFGLWWDPFLQSRKCMSLKFTEELCIMTMENDVKLAPLTKVYVWAKKSTEKLYDGTEDWCKIWRKTDLCFEKWHEEFDKFA